jgi:hypothetical protein
VRRPIPRNLEEAPRVPAPFTGWSPAGILALIAIAAGIVLLIAYAVQRGLVHRELEGIETAAEPGTEVAPAVVAPPRGSRTLGMAGAVLLVVGLGLGAVAALGNWTAGDAATGGPGPAPADCAQSWDGCPKATQNP